MNRSVAWDNGALEPVVITYNRAEYLRKTLQVFVDAGLQSMRLHILDNASTDHTAQLVEQFRAQWPHLTYHRNQYNIGGNGNILRALEISDSEYSWVIGDDDEWHLEHVGELLDAVRTRQADVVRLGWLVADDVRGRVAEARELALTEPFFFASLSMISATVARRALIAPHLAHAYQNTGDAYPQLVPFMRALESGSYTVYSTRADIVVHTPNAAPGYYFGDLEWYAAWMRSGRFLPARYRAKFSSEVHHYMTRARAERLGAFGWYSKVALNYKARGVNQWPYLLCMLGYGTGVRASIAAVMLVYALVPAVLARMLRRLYLKLRGQPDRPLRHDRTRV